MGADQSRTKPNTNDTTTTSPQYIKQCYYEVLTIARDADETDIKKAYRKLALLYHPDRNIDNPEAATERFKLVQEAYDVLSDADERAWYDSHRESILTGKKVHTSDNDNGPTATSDFESRNTGFYDVDIYKYFSTTCYSKFDDSPKSFYTVYRQVFETVASLENDGDEMPMFGDMHSDYSDVRQFYTVYTNFVTSRTFDWRSKWKLSDAPSRMHKRVMQTENQQAIKAAKKEYNDTVRQLAMFVRKRDPRVLKQQVIDAEQERIKQAEQLRVKQEQDRQRADLREQHKQTEQDRYEIQEKQRQQAYSWAYKQEQTRNEIENKLADVDEYVCQLCNKVFKSEGQYRNHEASKKHKDNVNRLKRQVGSDAVLDDGADGAEHATEHECIVCELKFNTQKKLYLHEQSATHERRIEAVKQRMLAEELARQQAEFDAMKLAQKAADSNVDTDQNGTIDAKDSTATLKPKPTKKQRRAFQKQKQAMAAMHESDSDDSVIASKPTIKSSRRSKRSASKRHNSRHISSSDNESSNASDSDSSSGDNDSDNVPVKATTHAQSSSSSSSSGSSASDSSDDDEEPAADHDSASAQPNVAETVGVKLSAKQKKQMRQEKKTAKNKHAKSDDAVHKCTVCSSSFSSRTKLFAHIKEKKHAALKTG